MLRIVSSEVRVLVRSSSYFELDPKNEEHGAEPTENRGWRLHQEVNTNPQVCVELGGFHAIMLCSRRMKSTRSEVLKRSSFR